MLKRPSEIDRLKRLSVVCAILAIFVYAGIVDAQPAPPMAPSAEMFKRFCADEHAIFQSRMAFIEAKLALRPEQYTAFSIFVEEARSAGQPLRNLCKEGLPKDEETVTDRIAALQKGERAMSQVRSGFAAAVTKFTAALTPEQDKELGRAIFPPHSATGFLQLPPPP